MTDATHLARRWVVPMSVLVLAVLVLPACSSARENARDINLSRDFTLVSGDVLVGDQVVWAYTIFLETGSAVEGDATLVGDSVTVDGAIDGTVTVVADTFVLGPQASITGDADICATTLTLSDTAAIGGIFREECSNSRRVSAANLIESGWASWRESWFFRLSSLVIGSLFFGALAALGTILFPDLLNHISDSIQMAPFKTGGIGGLTLLVAVGMTALYLLSLLLVFPVILLPFVIVLWVVLGLSSALGWVALAEPFGERFLRRLGLSEQPRMVAAMVGGITLALLLRVWSLFWFTAWFGLLTSAILVSFGLGAVLITRMGTKPYKPSRSAAVDPAVRPAK